MNVLIAGGTGFVGRRLAAALAARGDVVTVVSRDPAGARRKPMPGVSFRGWLPPLDGYDAVVNLAGEPIFGPRWNKVRKAQIRDSRVEATRVIVDSIAASTAPTAVPQTVPPSVPPSVPPTVPPSVLVNASAIGFYGDRGSETLAENAAPGSDFMAGVCKDWEAEARKCPVRTVILRLGVVLGENGGALAQMLPPFRLGIGGPIGFGHQYFSWIAIDDLVAMILWAIDNRSVKGVLNATSPGTVTNAAFSRALGRALSRPAFFMVPALALRLKFGPVAEVLTASQRCTSAAAQAQGFVFRQPEIEGALRSVLGR